MEELIKLGWDVNFVDEGETLLYFACFQNNEKAVEILLNHMHQIDPPNATPAVCLLCRSHNPNIAKMILSKNIDVYRLDENGRFGPYYLRGGEEKNNLAILSMLYDHGYDINYKGRNGVSIFEPFLINIIKSQNKIIEWLILHGADTNSIIKETKYTQGKVITVKHNKYLK